MMVIGLKLLCYGRGVEDVSFLWNRDCFVFDVWYSVIFVVCDFGGCVLVVVCWDCDGVGVL